MKKLTLVVLLGALCFSLAACGSKEDADTSADVETVTGDSSATEVETEDASASVSVEIDDSYPTTFVQTYLATDRTEIETGDVRGLLGGELEEAYTLEDFDTLGEVTIVYSYYENGDRSSIVNGEDIVASSLSEALEVEFDVEFCTVHIYFTNTETNCGISDMQIRLTEEEKTLKENFESGEWMLYMSYPELEDMDSTEALAAFVEEYGDPTMIVMSSYGLDENGNVKLEESGFYCYGYYMVYDYEDCVVLLDVQESSYYEAEEVDVYFCARVLYYTPEEWEKAFEYLDLVEQ